MWEHELPFEEQADRNWLDNDILGFINNNMAMMHGYDKYFYTVLSRSFKYRHIETKDKNEIRKICAYTMHFFHGKVNSGINFWWGLLKPEERERFIVLNTPDI